jgi:hypothetical protein
MASTLDTEAAQPVLSEAAVVVVPPRLVVQEFLFSITLRTLV